MINHATTISVKSRIFIIFIIIFLIFPIFGIPAVNADISYRVDIDEVVGRRNIVITYPVDNKKYLIYLTTGCGAFEKGQTIQIVARGPLDGINDIIKSNAIHKCNIERADLFTNKIYVQSVFGENTKAYILDENGRRFYISYSQACSAIAGYKNTHVYVFQAGDFLSRNDRIILPDRAGECSIYYMQEVRPAENEKTKIQDKAPDTVANVKAYPRNGGVFLTWRSARDDKGISHYVISYSKYRFNPKGVSLDDMPDRIVSKPTHYTITGLDNDMPYYFYVIAVDTGGNMSSDWSEAAEAVPKSSLFQVQSGVSAEKMNIRVADESAASFLIRWNHISGSRQTVIMELDGTRELAWTDYSKNQIRILKTPKRKGKIITLKVRSHSIYESVKEERIDFSFR